MCSWQLRGPWRPGTHNIVLLISQIVVIWTAAQRGMDYVQSSGRLSATQSVDGTHIVSTLSGIESDVPLSVLGLSLLIPAGFAFFGLATGWAKPLSLGHLFIGSSYLVLGITFLKDSPIDNYVTAGLGSTLLLASAWLLVTGVRRVPDIISMAIGVLALTIGGWLAAKGLGYGYRTGNGFIGASVLHFIFGFGTQILARRDAILRREEEEDLAALRTL